MNSVNQHISDFGVSSNEATHAIVGWSNTHGSGVLAWTNNEFHAHLIKKDINNDGGSCRIDTISDYGTVNDYLNNVQMDLLKMINN